MTTNTIRETGYAMTRQLRLAVRLAAKDADTTPEELVERVLTEWLAANAPTVAGRVQKYQDIKAAAWKAAETGAWDRLIEIVGLIIKAVAWKAAEKGEK